MQLLRPPLISTYQAQFLTPSVYCLNCTTVNKEQLILDMLMDNSKLDTLTWFHSNGNVPFILYAIMKYWELFSLQSMYISNQSNYVYTYACVVCISNNVLIMRLHNALIGRNDI